MNNIIQLHGINYEEDKAIIKNSIKENPIYIFDNRTTALHKYIDSLYFDYGVKNKTIHRFKICNDIAFENNITLLTRQGKEVCRPHNMEELLRNLNAGNHYSLIVENNSRTLMANVLQQLIYVDYPITEINFNLRKEYKDAAKTKRFMQNIGYLYDAAKKALTGLDQITIDDSADNYNELFETRASAIQMYKKILEQIEKAKNVEMKVAVAASKKTGKSVIANCMFGMELAPTSLELATPNSCIYKKSPDEKYHLTYNEKTEDFQNAQELFRRIQSEFKKAQSDADRHFTIPDMEIYYVSNRNNFEAYTIYDTPGPDATGTNHRESAMRAINLCDVAIFAIDYSKHLTEDEEKYLKKIKTLFEEKNKFHTLIFVINKMDLALNDKEAKSRIKSIDYIRERLSSIDKQYKDCVIFATSAQDYFYSLELLQAAKSGGKCSVFLKPETDLYRKLREVKDELEEDDCENEELINVLSNLDAEVGKIKSQLGYPSVNMDTLQNFSGIPQLMNYVSYIAKNKAREEIVNSLTYTIDAQYKSIQVIFNKVANIEAMMGKNQQEIEQISNILNRYSQEVREILTDELTPDDQKVLEKKWLASQINKISGQKSNESINLSVVLSSMRSDISADTQTFKKSIWDAIKLQQSDLIKQNRGTIVSMPDLILDSQKIHELVENCLEKNMSEKKRKKDRDFQRLVTDLQNIITHRFEKINESSRKCQQELRNNNCYLELPTQPAFDVSIPVPDINWRIGDIKIDGSLFESKFKKLNTLHKIIRKIFRGKDRQQEVKVPDKKHLTDDDILAMIDKVQGDVLSQIETSGIPEAYQEYINQFADNIINAEKIISDIFKETNDNCQNTINIFKKNIDNRAYYEAQLDSLEKLKSLISDIKDSSYDFQKIWNKIVQDEALIPITSQDSHIEEGTV